MRSCQLKRHISLVDTHNQDTRQTKRANLGTMLGENHQAPTQARRWSIESMLCSEAETPAEENYGVDEEVMEIDMIPPAKPITTTVPQPASDAMSDQAKTQASKTAPAAEENYGLDEEVMEIVRRAMIKPEKPIGTVVPPDAVPRCWTPRPRLSQLLAQNGFPVEPEEDAYDSEDEMILKRSGLWPPAKRPARLSLPRVAALDIKLPLPNEPRILYPNYRLDCPPCRSSQTTCSLHYQDPAIYAPRPKQPPHTEEMGDGVYERFEAWAAENSVPEPEDDEEAIAEIERDPEHMIRREVEANRRFWSITAWRSEKHGTDPPDFSERKTRGWTRSLYY
ncbi:hypothetical protein B0T19DRAFT_260389 [Cercophora scortea]|uniref:Uncharacterized protein n=1 Tax=Cercophora scortea TaxID=314031 RepID=A0AAE0I9R7_9PEZI|nr:hypothetical protein B0T19DRAFT_260389 [Cercophora scortea]